MSEELSLYDQRCTFGTSELATEGCGYVTEGCEILCSDIDISEF